MAQTGSVVVNITVGSWFKPAVLTDSDGYDNTAGLLLTGSDGYDNTVGLLLTGSDGPFVFYCFIIYFNLYFFVESGFALYTLTTGDRLFAECQVVCRVLFSGTRQRRLCRVFFLTLGKETLCRVFFLTLGKENFKAHFEAVN